MIVPGVQKVETDETDETTGIGQTTCWLGKLDLYDKLIGHIMKKANIFLYNLAYQNENYA